jgi:thiaminase/transcriptional activator TenA
MGKETMTLSEKLKKDADSIWESIYVHPFVKELFEGTLPEQKFRLYILQDYHYLVASIRNFSLLASKAENVKTMKALIDLACIESMGELRAYENLLKTMDLTIDRAQNEENIQEAVSYISFLLSTSSLKSPEEGITAVLPCYWSYAEIAKFHETKLASNRNKLYREWASYYFQEDYLNLVNKIKRLVDQIREEFPYNKLRYVFTASSKYEYMFWNAVYHYGEPK